MRRSCVQMKGEVLEYFHSKNEESIMKSECAVGGRWRHYQRVTAHMYSIVHINIKLPTSSGDGEEAF